MTLTPEQQKRWDTAYADLFESFATDVRDDNDLIAATFRMSENAAFIAQARALVNVGIVAFATGGVIADEDCNEVAADFSVILERYMRRLDKRQHRTAERRKREAAESAACAGTGEPTVSSFHDRIRSDIY
jgi:hypothetical protein